MGAFFRRAAAFWEPNESDIILGRGTSTSVVNHPGNIWFRALIEDNIMVYSAIVDSSRNKRVKIRFISGLIDIIHEEGRHFVKKQKTSHENPNEDGWYDISMAQAHQKTGQALRDAMLAKKKAQESKEESSETKSALEYHGVLDSL